MHLGEALEIEAVKCAAGDARHDFQEWYPKYLQLRKKHRANPNAPLDDADPAEAADEAARMKQAIDETEQMLADHRLAVVENRASPYSNADVDGLYALLESLKANLPAVEAMAQAASDDEGEG